MWLVVLLSCLVLSCWTQVGAACRNVNDRSQAMARALAGATRRLTRTMSLPPLPKALSVFAIDRCILYAKSDAGCGHRMLCVCVCAGSVGAVSLCYG